MSGHNRVSAPWWRTAAIYQIYIRSFADADGDGVGDLTGVRNRLEYLAELGVDALWLTPFYASPMVDGGYDVADYRAVDPLFGTLSDAETLIDEAHRHGLRLIMDIVPNHTSAQHPWFRQARRARPGSAARDRYIFRDGVAGEPPNDWESMFGGSAWSQVPDGQWYLHLFAPEQPDLNWHHPEVRTEFADILRFWLDRGVDGFRIDVAHGLIKDEHLSNVGSPDQAQLLTARRLPYFDQDGVHEIYREWRRILDSYPGERIAVAEAWVRNSDRLARYIRPDELHQAFNFPYLQTEWGAQNFRTVIEESLHAVSGVSAPATWVLSNHDTVRHVTRYGGGSTGLRRARAAALLTFALPGSVYLYQGEELGLPEVTDLPEEVLTDPLWERSGRTERGRDGCRVPLPWSGTEPPFGFGGTPWLPQPSDWANKTVTAQLTEKNSTLRLYRQALRLRRNLPTTPLRWIELGSEVLAFRRSPGFTCAVNFGSTPVSIPHQGTVLLTSVPWAEFGSTAESVRLPPNSAAWWNDTGAAHHDARSAEVY